MLDQGFIALNPENHIQLRLLQFLVCLVTFQQFFYLALHFNSFIECFLVRQESEFFNFLDRCSVL